MPRTLDIPAQFKADAEDLIQARKSARLMHRTGDIRAAGNQVEQAVRDYLRRMLPPRYHVTHGHLIDPRGCISPQIDVIIADNFGLPSLLTARDGTEYIPIDSVYAIGEIKSTYRYSEKPFEKFHSDLSHIHRELNRPLIENTAFGGITGSTLMEHLTIRTDGPYMNHLFSFFLCIVGGDFSFHQLHDVLTSSDIVTLPNMAVLLDVGMVLYGKMENNALNIHKYPVEGKPQGYEWCFMQGLQTASGSLPGAHLSTLYAQLVRHLSMSYLAPPDAHGYTKDMWKFSSSSIRWL